MVRGVRNRSRNVSLRLESLESRCVLAAIFPAYIDGTLTLGNSGSGPPYAIEDTFKLESRPTATKTIYLDFDGYHSQNNWWGHDIVFPPFNLNADPSTLANGELISVQKQWQNVAEDFLPFDVNVTTKDPGVEALQKTSPTDEEYGIRVVATQATAGFGSGIGGIAFLFSFDAEIDNPVFAFNKGDTNGGMTISHEVGHALGLFHDGLGTREYHPGTGSGQTAWGPLMGAPFNRNLTQWSDGDYADATNTEDDLTIIIDPANGFDFRPDDYGNTRFTAEALDFVDGEAFKWGVIERNTDLDYFSFDTQAGDVSFEIRPFGLDANLDIQANLYDQSGNLVLSINEADSLRADFDVTLPAGSYTLGIDGVGLPGRYDDYGSLGFYSITATLPTIDGDFDDDGDLDGDDIDALTADIAAGNNTPAFDLTQDGVVDLADRDSWLAQAGAVNLPSGNPYLLGDADLSGAVDGADFLRWNDNKFTTSDAWTRGDFNADGAVDGADMILWNDFKFMASDDGIGIRYNISVDVDASDSTASVPQEYPFWPLAHDHLVHEGHQRAGLNHHHHQGHAHAAQHNAEGDEPCGCAECCGNAVFAGLAAEVPTVTAVSDVVGVANAQTADSSTGVVIDLSNATWNRGQQDLRSARDRNDGQNDSDKYLVNLPWAW